MTTTTHPGATLRAGSTGGRRALYSPAIDFFLLGGASLVLLPLAALIPDELAPRVLFWTTMLSFLINYPHFAHSYQIFYRDYPNKLRGRGYPAHLQWRYLTAGLVIPLAMGLLMWAGYRSGEPTMLGYWPSIMGFVVGWHYVKQGYGMLMVDSALNRAYFNDAEKKLLRINAYACWLFFFVVGSQRIAGREYFGIPYHFVPLPDALPYLLGAAVVVTSALTLRAVVAAARRHASRPVPWSGHVAYFFSLYIWIAAIWSKPVLYVIPALHSLQYLAVVWRYEFNRRSAQAAPPAPDASAPARTLRLLAPFVLLGIVLGGLGFFYMPMVLDIGLSYDREAFGAKLFAFLFFIFINVHHYFLDNVMWRKDNPDVGRHLFS